MKRFTDENGGVHPIILNNKQNEREWFNADGNYVHMFDGIDGNTYYIVVPPEKWPPFIWEQYEREGISVDGPTPVEEINYPEKSSE